MDSDFRKCRFRFRGREPRAGAQKPRSVGEPRPLLPLQQIHRQSLPKPAALQFAVYGHIRHQAAVQGPARQGHLLRGLRRWHVRSMAHLVQARRYIGDLRSLHLLRYAVPPCDSSVQRTHPAGARFFRAYPRPRAPSVLYTAGGYNAWTFAMTKEHKKMLDNGTPDQLKKLLQQRCQITPDEMEALEEAAVIVDGRFSFFFCHPNPTSSQKTHSLCVRTCAAFSCSTVPHTDASPRHARCA